MKNIATVTSKGQLTVPLAVRNRLGLKEGDRVEFVMHGTQTTIQPLRGEANPFADFAGALGTFAGGRQAINAWLKELRDDDEVVGSPRSQASAKKATRPKRPARTER